VGNAVIKIPRLHANQQKVKSEARRFNVLQCGRRFGKTTFGEDLVYDSVEKGHKICWAAPTYRYLSEPQQTIEQALKPLISSYNKQERQIHFINGARLDFWPIEKGDVGVGFDYDRVIVDEAAKAANLGHEWNKALRATLMDRKGDAWFLSTPKGREAFHEFYLRGQSEDEKWGEWMSWRMPTMANPYIDEGEIQAMRDAVPDWIAEQEIDAIPAANGGNPFGDAYIDACYSEVPMALIEHGPPVVFGIDLARSRDHCWVIGLDMMGNVVVSKRWQGRSWRETYERIEALMGSVPALIDATGAGDPIVEELAMRGNPVIPFKFSPKSKQELMEGLAVAFQHERVRFNDRVLLEELKSFGYEISARSGTVRYSAPNGKHDDGVMALALAVKMANDYGVWADDSSLVWHTIPSKAVAAARTLRGLT